MADDTHDPNPDGMLDDYDFLDREALLRTFASEAQENLAEMQQSLIALESTPDDAELINGVFRAAHTLKGNSATVGLDAVVEIAHHAEDLLDELRTGHFTVTRGLITLLLQCVDTLEWLIPAAMADPAVVVDSRLSDALRAAVASGDHVVSNDGPNAAAAPSGSVTSHAGTLRVSVQKLDVMMNVAGEIAIARGRLRNLIERMGNSSRELSETEELLDRLCSDLQDLVMSVRLVPIEPVFQQQVRVVRDLALAAGKSARVVLEGKDVELDTNVIEQIRDPLTHMMRNAVDHGIEAPERRIAAGKPPRGTITLRAFHESGMIVVQVADDGSGIDENRIVSRARALGLIDATSTPTQQQIFELVFAPGVTSTDSVTEVSGRGVGMDVVQRNINSLRGTVALDSVRGAGTTVTIRLPLTMAIIDALAVGVGTQTFVVPLDGVIECIDVTEQQLDSRGTGFLDIRGEAVPFVRLSSCLGIHASETSRRSLLLVRSGTGRAGVVVDRLYNRTQAVIKPLWKPLPRRDGITGATILGNGTVALILDLPRILRQQLKEAA